MSEQQAQQTQPEERMQAIGYLAILRAIFALLLWGKNHEQRKKRFSREALKASAQPKSEIKTRI